MKVCFFLYFGESKAMKYIQFIGLLLVVSGSFLPLVHVPVLGHWNYWQTDHSLAIICWLFCLVGLLGIVLNKKVAVQVASIFLLILFVFTLIAVRFQSVDFFSFLPFKSWQNIAASTVKLKAGWLLLFSGALLMLFAGKFNSNKN